VDFDHTSPEYAKRWIEILTELRENCPVAWSPRHEGFWVVTRHSDVADVSRDDASYSSQHDLGDDRAPAGYGGITIPAPPTRSVPIELDPPEFNHYRRMLNPAFSPAAVKRWVAHIEDITTACIDEHVESGTIDLVNDLTAPVPGIFTLGFLGVPLDEWRRWADPFHAVVANPAGTPEYDRAVDGIFWMIGQLEGIVADRRRHPTEDLISHLVTEEPDDDRVLEMCTLIIAGGVDTTTGLVASALHWLSNNRPERREMIEHPERLPIACEEFLRYFTPTQALARTVTHDVELRGQRLRAGERVLLSWASANRDPEIFDRPDELRIDRLPNRHVAFGLGVHRCLGSNLARAEFAIIVRQVLERIPDFTVTEDAQPYESIGIVNGWATMPATFTPGAKRGSTFQL
jgi:cytochrome P450